MPKQHQRPSTGKSPPQEIAPAVPDAADEPEGSLPLNANTLDTLLKGTLLLLEKFGLASSLSPEHVNLIWLLHAAAFKNVPEYRLRTAQTFLAHQEKDHATYANTVLTLTNTNAELVKQNRLLTDTVITSNANPTPKPNTMNTAQPMPAPIVTDTPAHPADSTWTRSERPQPITPTRHLPNRSSQFAPPKARRVGTTPVASTSKFGRLSHLTSE
ncbi:hypothetical protein BS47DRAFT_1101529 [Hydnum rufescens UP504]|uniref:Uncharacterized protein n=1 Tax=Hydnum rufescens UP504 TaxID=1448309 RepID=A0A9P6DV13_9AGAM|nr:hypothetical protein BS47DRAFT_1101529 [Hydnum rufescens UP504]